MDDEKILNALEKLKKKLRGEIEMEVTQLSRVFGSIGLQPIDMDSDYEDSSDFDIPDDSFNEEEGLLASIP